MAEEPQPSTVHEGADPPDALPANAEDRKAAQALSSLDAKGDDDDNDAAAPQKKEVDLKALSDAIKNLDVAGAGAGAAARKTADAAKRKAEEPPRPLVKVDQADVALLVDQLDISKTKATELLRAHDADPVRAMTAWVTTSA